VRKSSITKRLLPILVIGALALAVVLPMLVLGLPDGHDFEYHIDAWIDAAQQLRAGVWLPHWAALANYGFGEPRFVFYPPLSRWLGTAALVLFPANAAPGAYVFLLLLMAGGAMFALARRWLPPACALLAAAFYAVNPYLLLCVYQRDAYGEMLVHAFFPLVVLYASKLADGGADGSRLPAPGAGLARVPACSIADSSQSTADGQRPRTDKRQPTADNRQPATGNRQFLSGAIAPLAIVFAACWISDLPAAVIVTYSLALILVVLAVLHRSWAILVRGVLAMALGLALAGFFLVPATWEQRWVNIRDTITEEFRPENWEYTWTYDAEAEWYYAILSGIVYGGIALAALGAAVSVRWLLPGKGGGRPSPLATDPHPFAQSRIGYKSVAFRISSWLKQLSARNPMAAPFWILTSLAAASVFMLLPVSNFVWTTLPKLEYVQFPWRWLFVLSACIALLLAAAGSKYVGGPHVAHAGDPPTTRPAFWDGPYVGCGAEGNVNARYVRMALVTGCLLLIALAGGIATGKTAPFRHGAVAGYLEAATAEAGGYEGGSSFMPPGVTPEALASLRATPRALLAGGTVRILRWSPDQKSLQAVSASPTRIVLHLLNYPAWRATVNGKPAAIAADSFGRATISLSEGISRIEVSFARTPDCTLGDLLTGLALLATAALFIREYTQLSAEYVLGRVAGARHSRHVHGRQPAPRRFRPARF
jgi:hypothetical protein